MRIFSFILILSMILVPASAFAKDYREMYIQQVDKNVKLTAELENASDKRNDAIAVAGFTGAAVGAGAVQPVLGAVGGFIAAIPTPIAIIGVGIYLLRDKL